MRPSHLQFNINLMPGNGREGRAAGPGPRISSLAWQ
ncbi:hypothetical protein DEV91_10935 [Phyllobacterium brassicacearum]|nr:hypothetical protein DEV91_10935 [Phyllobacterium brassicacearum]